MMLFVTFTILFIAFSCAGRQPKLPRHVSRSGNAIDNRRHSTSASSEFVPSPPPDVDDYAVFNQAPLESVSANSNYDLFHMQDAGESLLRSLEDIRNQLSEQQPLDQLRGEKQRLLEAVDSNIVVVSVAVENIKRLLGTQDTLETYSYDVGDPQLKDLNRLLDAGEKEKRRLTARLMQLKKRWPPSSPDNRIPIDIGTSITDDKDGFGGQLRRFLLPESLSLHYDYDESHVALPPSHLGSGLLSDTGHEDEVFREALEENHNQPARAKQQVNDQITRGTHPKRNQQSVQVDQSNPQTPEGQLPSLQDESDSSIIQDESDSSIIQDESDSSITQQSTETSVTTHITTTASSADFYSVSALCFSVLVLIFFF